MFGQFIPRSTRPQRYLGAFRLPIVSVPVSDADLDAMSDLDQTYRKLSATPPASQGQPDNERPASPHPEGSNTLIILSALGALGGLYYYYTRGKPATYREAERHEEEEAKGKIRDIGETEKSKAIDAVVKGRRDYNQAKTMAEGAASSARSWASGVGTDAAERARQGAYDAQVKLDELKKTAERKMSDVRDRSEKRLEEDKEEAARKARAAEDKARGWFGWGSSK